MSKKKYIEKKSNVKTESKPPAKVFNLSTLFSWSKEYVHPWKLPQLVASFDGMGSFKESYILILFFQILQILPAVLGYIIILFIKPSGLSSNDPMLLLLQFVLLAIISTTLIYAGSWVLHYISKLFGGKADFGNQTYVLVLTSVVHRTVFFPIFVFSSILGYAILPSLFEAIIAVSVLFAILYPLFVQFHVIKRLNNFSNLRTAAVMALVVGLLALLFIVSVIMSLPTAS